MASLRELEAEHRKGQRRKLAEEAALLALLRQAATIPATGVLDVDSTLVRNRVFSAYLIGRRRSAEAAAKATWSELSLLTDGASTAIPFEENLGYEWFRAERAARGYAEAWKSSAYQEMELGAADPYRAAVRAQSWRLQMGAATENAESWTLAQNNVFDLAQPQIDERLYKQWDAAMDRRTCPICEGSHGIIVPIDSEFPAGRPGSVHPNCRCDYQVLPESWVDRGYLVAA